MLFKSGHVSMALGRTLLTQTARINVTAFPLLNSLLERIWVGQYESTVSKVSMTTYASASLSLSIYLQRVYMIYSSQYRVEKVLNLLPTKSLKSKNQFEKHQQQQQSIKLFMYMTSLTSLCTITLLFIFVYSHDCNNNSGKEGL